MKLIRSALLLGTGYVLGTRAGRERFEQIKSAAEKLWESTPLQKGREKARDAAAAGFEQASQTAADTAKNAAAAVKERFTSAEENLDDDVIVVDPVEG